MLDCLCAPALRYVGSMASAREALCAAVILIAMLCYATVDILRVLLA